MAKNKPSKDQKQNGCNKKKTPTAYKQAVNAFKGISKKAKRGSTFRG